MDGMSPRILHGSGLITIAYFKARLDEGDDHLGIFVPIVRDAVRHMDERRFTAADLQADLAARHGVEMPQEVVVTLLKRLARERTVVRAAGMYRAGANADSTGADLERARSAIQAAQLRLGAALQEHAARRSLTLAGPEAALELLLRFIKYQQVGILLGMNLEIEEKQGMTAQESAAAAEFVLDIAARDPALAGSLASILEGMVLYHAAFLPDFRETARRFHDFTVIIDSNLIRQALGYEGRGAMLAMREVIDILRDNGARCVALDKSLQEIRRILYVFEDKLRTSEGRAQLRSTAMARHFLTQRYAPSNVQEMSALLEEEVASLGLNVIDSPARVAAFTHGEMALSRRLADINTGDTSEPRVLHDVDCIAAVLTLRRGHRARRLEEARAIFATSSSLLIKNVRAWWEDDEHESGFLPVVHVRALANMAWLKRPKMNPGFQLSDMVALCAAAMRPSAESWQRFLRHLDKLQKENRLTADQASALLGSSTTDRCLREIEEDWNDINDVDVSTLDEAVDRVIEELGAKANAQIVAATNDFESRAHEIEAMARVRVEAAESEMRNVAELMRRQDLKLERRAQCWSRAVASWMFWLAAPIVMSGVAYGALSVPVAAGIAGPLLAIAVILVGALEMIGVLGHLRQMRMRLESRLLRVFRGWLSGAEEPNVPSDGVTDAGGRMQN